jgi:hypothetical protein
MPTPRSRPRSETFGGLDVLLNRGGEHNDQHPGGVRFLQPLDRCTTLPDRLVHHVEIINLWEASPTG